MEIKAMDIYDIMEEKLKDDARSIKTIKILGKELIEKMKLIDYQIRVINPNHIKHEKLPKEDQSKMTALYILKKQYMTQFDMITVVLNQRDEIVNSFTRNKFKEVGLEDRFFIENLEK